MPRNNAVDELFREIDANVVAVPVETRDWPELPENDEDRDDIDQCIEEPNDRIEPYYFIYPLPHFSSSQFNASAAPFRSTTASSRPSLVW